MEETLFKEVLGKIVADPHLEREWLEVLSQLEYVGCRKIIKSQRFETITLGVLQHLSEEASHAYLLKDAASRLGDGKEKHWSQSKFSKIGWTYFQNLDHQISEKFSDRAYPMVSWAVEYRVMKIYPQYVEMTQNELVRKTLKTIIQQEARHAKQFSDWQDSRDKKIALSIESGLWRDVLTELSHLSCSELYWAAL